MNDSHFDQMKRLVGFGPADAEQLGSLADRVRPFLPEIAEYFWGRLEQDLSLIHISEPTRPY